MGSIKEDLDWSGTLLGGLTIMPYVSHSISRGQPCVVSSMSLGYTDQDCGDYRFDERPPSPLHFDSVNERERERERERESVYVYVYESE